MKKEWVRWVLKILFVGIVAFATASAKLSYLEVEVQQCQSDSKTQSALLYEMKGKLNNIDKNLDTLLQSQLSRAR